VNRHQLEHVLRAAADVAGDRHILVIGSQAILGSGDEPELPVEATRSIEVDLAFFDDPDETKADAVDGAIGELSKFHQTFGYYGQGVGLGTAVLPEGWRARLIALATATAPEAVRFLEAHDCVVSKLVAFRQKDREFAEALLLAGIVDRETLLGRVDQLPPSVSLMRRDALIAWLRGRQGSRS
jgi:hypothetical protein